MLNKLAKHKKAILIGLIILVALIVINRIGNYKHSIEIKELAYCFHSLDDYNGKIKYFKKISNSTSNNVKTCKDIIKEYDKKFPVKLERLSNMQLETMFPVSVLLNDGSVLIIDTKKNNAQYYSFEDKKFYKITSNIFNKVTKEKDCIFKDPILMPDGNVYYFNQVYYPDKKKFDNVDSGYALKLKEFNNNVNSINWLKTNNLRLIKTFTDGKTLFKKGKNKIILIDPFDIEHFKPAILAIYPENSKFFKLKNDNILFLEEENITNNNLNSTIIYNSKKGEISNLKNINWFKSSRIIEIKKDNLMVLDNQDSYIINLTNNEITKINNSASGNPYLLKNEKLIFIKNECWTEKGCIPKLFNLDNLEFISLLNSKLFCDYASVTVLKDGKSILIVGGDPWLLPFAMNSIRNKAFLITVKDNLRSNDVR